MKRGESAPHMCTHFLSKILFFDQNVLVAEQDLR